MRCYTIQHSYWLDLRSIVETHVVQRAYQRIHVKYNRIVWLENRHPCESVRVYEWGAQRNCPFQGHTIFINHMLLFSNRKIKKNTSKYQLIFELELHDVNYYYCHRVFVSIVYFFFFLLRLFLYWFRLISFGLFGMGNWIT